MKILRDDTDKTLAKVRRVTRRKHHEPLEAVALVTALLERQLATNTVIHRTVEPVYRRIYEDE